MNKNAEYIFETDGVLFSPCIPLFILAYVCSKHVI